MRKGIIEEITPAASPGFDFFLLVVLSCSIATLGLITNSPAVIIGAMLVAPLMSPIIGIGLASITGNTTLFRNAFSALLRGALLAVALATLMTLVNNLLPFFSIQELPQEILARTRPTPIDLVIALAGGVAAAYALTEPNLSAALPGVAIATALMPPLCTIGIGIALNRWDVAGGATLLFITNTITIAFASVLVFFLRGFSSSFHIQNHKIPRSLVVAALLTALLLVPLSYFSFKFFKEASENRLINTVVAEQVRKPGRCRTGRTECYPQWPEPGYGGHHPDRVFIALRTGCGAAKGDCGWNSPTSFVAGQPGHRRKPEPFDSTHAYEYSYADLNLYSRAKPNGYPHADSHQYRLTYCHVYGYQYPDAGSFGHLNVNANSGGRRNCQICTAGVKNISKSKWTGDWKFASGSKSHYTLWQRGL